MFLIFHFYDFFSQESFFNNLLSKILIIMKMQLQIANPTILLIFLFSLIISTTSSAKCVYNKPLKIKTMEMGNMLAWSTAQEVDVQMFVIQKSSNGIDFKRIGDVKGSGHTNKNTAYRFLDFSLPETKNYYRLLHYAADGSFTISETFLLEQSSKKDWMVESVSSTLTNKALHLTVDSRKPTSISFEVKNKSGKVIQRGTKQMKVGDNVISINCDTFINGQYDVVLKANNRNAKITVQKVSEREMPPLEYVAMNR